jgi:hypothetical protein
MRLFGKDEKGAFSYWLLAFSFGALILGSS